ncbi:unnamed protein product [Soboliphyme baturini]|uniref:BHLH domain-containing protein n=1 Tax=Soboliphyme baturini TaxID=241478 RepID=A0A183IWJ8_9BILA|nr:unnamed protein product [Soboliphyme baturini]
MEPRPKRCCSVDAGLNQLPPPPRWNSPNKSFSFYPTETVHSRVSTHVRERGPRRRMNVSFTNDRYIEIMRENYRLLRQIVNSKSTLPQRRKKKLSPSMPITDHLSDPDRALRLERIRDENMPLKMNEMEAKRALSPESCQRNGEELDVITSVAYLDLNNSLDVKISRIWKTAWVCFNPSLDLAAVHTIGQDCFQQQAIKTNVKQQSLQARQALPWCPNSVSIRAPEFSAGVPFGNCFTIRP